MKRYVSTRGQQEPIDFFQSVIQGLGNDGGLLIPDFEYENVDLSKLQSMSYAKLAAKILSCFIDCQDDKVLEQLCHQAYGSFFKDEVVPVKKVNQLYIAELFHGPTAAFKDMALSLLPYLMTYSLRQKLETRHVKILTATSGDTGKAALEGFKNIEGTSIIVFYPEDGISKIQKQQMITQSGTNVKVVGIHGHFDDAQKAVKKAFEHEKIKALCSCKNIFLSSANSINIGRLIPQVVYYFYAYLSLVNNGDVTLGDKVNFTIPSGNFGNCLAGYIAKKMGLPIHKLIVASNKNHVLTDFFQTGTYHINRDFYQTNAPAMDILVSSNLERLLYILGCQPEEIKKLMKQLEKNGAYQVDDDLLGKIKEEFYADWLEEDETLNCIQQCYSQDHYLLDTHSAIGYGVYQKYCQDSHDSTPTILLATASPYKFASSIYQALTNQIVDDEVAIDLLYQLTNIAIPKPLQNIFDMSIIHQTVIDKDDIIDYMCQEIGE